MEEKIVIGGKLYQLIETVTYPNDATSYFYIDSGASIAIIIDCNIYKCDNKDDAFRYSLITDKQNQYMNSYRRVYRFLYEDMDKIESCMLNYDLYQRLETYRLHAVDRGNNADASPLELRFETNFANVYGRDSIKYLWKEYGITNEKGDSYFLDYVVKTTTGEKAVEENGVSYHHPQIIGINQYRRQLDKQNTCTNWGITLYRFSTDDCVFEDRIEDDIRQYFGETTEKFTPNGMLVERKIKLYEHQENSLQEIQKQRREGFHTFLLVFPTASGKSKIVEEDIKIFAEGMEDFRALILAPNTNIIEDWNQRIHVSLSEYKNRIDVRSYAYMVRNFQNVPYDYYDYIVIDEAHHAVAPALKRVIQYYNPKFMIGLTATDQRPDKKKLETIFGSYKTNFSLQDAMEKEIVAKANVYRIETNIDLSQVRFNGKDYVNADLEKSIRVTSRNELIVNVLKEYFNEDEMINRQGIIFCVNTTHTKELERLLNEAGIPSRAYHSKSNKPEEIMEDFKNHKIRFLCACNMISEGWDYPELGILVMARPTLSQVLYLQQIGRGLRRTSTKKNVFVIDVVDQYGAMIRPCSMHAIFHNSLYVPFGDITNRNYQTGDMIEIDGLHERVERIMEVDINTFEEKYGSYLSQEQLAREYYVSTGTITSWIKKGKIKPSTSYPFGSKQIYLFSPEDVKQIREDLEIPEHNDETIKTDFFSFLEERDYSLSYKMPFLLSFLKHMDSIGDAQIEDVLTDYIAFYQDRIDRGLQVDRSTCPYNKETLKNRTMIKNNMLTNPFEKFERKRFLYYSKNLQVISMNHSLLGKLDGEDIVKVEDQMKDDLESYYESMGGL